jgi:CheY-like chemotaxis protein
MVSVALGATRTLSQIIADILDLSRFERGLVHLALGPVDPAAVAAGVAASFRSLPGKEGLQIAACAGPGIPGGLLGDTARLRQVLFNLVGNAVKFTRQGRVEVEVHFLSRVRDRVHLLFRVRDTGVGIAADQMERLFEPFVQGDGSLTRRFGGAGLGLAIARKLVELMDGHILVESEPDRGTCVEFTAVLRGGIGAEAGPLGLERVLVVGDAAAREPVEAFLEALGLGHASLDEASRVLEVLDQGDFDAVVLDVPFPAPDGATPARVIRDSGLPCRNLPIIGITGCVRMDEAWLRAAGITACLSRPVTLSGLEEALRCALVRVRP